MRSPCLRQHSTRAVHDALSLRIRVPTARRRRRDAPAVSYLHPHMPLTSDQFASALLAILRQQPLAGTVAEQRREPRVSVTGMVVLTSDDSDDPPIHARLKDISRGGVGFTHHAGLPKGRRMILHLPSSEDEAR